MSERIIVTFEYTPEPGDTDPDDHTGLTAEAYERLHDGLRSLGAFDITVIPQ